MKKKGKTGARLNFRTEGLKLEHNEVIMLRGLISRETVTGACRRFGVSRTVMEDLSSGWRARSETVERVSSTLKAMWEAGLQELETRERERNNHGRETLDANASDVWPRVAAEA